MMDSANPTVSVIVSHVNSARTIGRCLVRLLQQDYPSDQFQIIVVDAGSTDGSIEIVSKMESKSLRLIVAPKTSESEGQSQGIQSSKSEVIMFTNSDIYVPPDWIKKHVAWLREGYDLVGGRVFWGGDKFSLTWNMPTPKTPQYAQQQGLGLGFSNCSFPRELLERVGRIMNLNSQHDTEFAFRVVRSGGKLVLDPSTEVYHDHPLGSFRASFTRSFGYARNHVIVMRGIYGRIVSGSGSPAMLPLSSIVKELTLINAVKTYKEIRFKAYQNNIRVGLLEFLFIRLFSTKLGQFLGVFAGAIKPKVRLTSVKDFHKRTTQEGRLRLSVSAGSYS